jgi:diketogulonate reductase-like aldo/keto reductase
MRRNYEIFITDGYSTAHYHAPNGEHPIGLALDIVPYRSRGGTWRKITELAKLAEKHGKTPAQILLNWNAARGNIVLPKSLTAHRIQSNFDSFDFQLPQEDIDAINSLGKEVYVTGSMHKSKD